jgi:hypothetical protein
MNRILSKLALVAVLGTGLTALAADEKKTAPAKKADWSHFAVVTTVAGEVVETTEDGVTLKVSQTTLSRTGGRRPRVRANTKSQELQFVFAEAGLVRWKSLPPKLDDNGKKLPRSSKELTELKLPKGTPGFAAERGDLQPGQIVELTLVRPKSIPSSKVTFQDLKVKYAMILADPNGGAGGGKKATPKKK